MNYVNAASDGTRAALYAGTGLGVNVHTITIQTTGNATDTGYDIITNHQNGGQGVSGNAS